MIVAPEQRHTGIGQMARGFDFDVPPVTSVFGVLPPVLSENRVE